MRPLKNTLVVIADCLRNDAMPGILLKGCIYDAAWACGSATIPAFASLYTGLLPHQHGHVTRHSTPVGMMLPGRLPDHNPLFVTENPFTRWAGHLIQADGAGIPYIVENLPPEPWLVIYHSMITHWPYGGSGHEHKHYYKENDEAGRHTLTQLYMAGVDKFVAAFLALEAEIKPDVSIITADHGDGLMEHGFFGHPAGRMFPELLNVPLVVRDGKRNYTYRAPFSMVSFPGLVHAAGVLGKRVRAIPGEECYSAGYRDREPMVASIRCNDTLVIVSKTRAPMQYDLATDPKALHPSRDIGAIMPVLCELDAGLEETLTDEETVMKRLEALGYV